ncbi:MAG TPA: hypothetical protein EYH12_02920 [Psychromonas hadalis]|nr:hypothetical protein [Psychromonas hadalis]
MKNVMLMSALILLLSACSQTSKEGSSDSTNKKRRSYKGQAKMATHRSDVSTDFKKGMQLTEIVADLADQLYLSLSEENKHQTIALSSLVELEDFHQSSWLGKTISEQFFQQLHLRELTLLDYKLTDTIMLTKKGDFSLTQIHERKKTRKN